MHHIEKANSIIQVHLGCGNEKIPGFVNIDTRKTSAVDHIADLNDLSFLQDDSISCFFSNAFFEHLYRNSRLPHLQQAFRALKASDGFCCYIGIPFFPTIAKLYLEKGPGVVGSTFDLSNVYRYTHGYPEQAPSWWLEQLHKSLFDEQELTTLLNQSGFTHHVIFNYCYPGEEGRPVCCGFYATKQPASKTDLQKSCLTFIEDVAKHRVIMHTIEFL